MRSSKARHRLPQHRAATLTSRLQWLLYATCAAVTAGATTDPTWPKWQAVLMAAFVGASIATAVRDAWWRRELTQHQGEEP